MIERKAPLAQGRAVGARVSAEPENYLLAGLASSALPPVPTHERQHFRSRSPLVGGGRIGCRQALTHSGAPSTGIFVGAGAGYAILKP